MLSVGLGFAISLLFTVAGISIQYWFWKIPHARQLLARARECEDTPIEACPLFVAEATKGAMWPRRPSAAGTLPCTATRDFEDHHSRLARRLRVLTIRDLAEDELDHIFLHFIVFVIVIMMLMAISLVKISEVAASSTEHASNPVALVHPSSSLLSQIEDIVGRLRDVWVAPYMEVAFFFMVAYAIIMLLLTFGKVNRATD